MLLPWLIFSPPSNCTGGKRICSCQSVSHPPLLSCLSVCLSLMLSVFLCHFTFIILFLPCFFFSHFPTRLTSAPAKHQNLSVSLALSVSSHQCLSPSALTNGRNHHRDALHSRHLHASQPYHWLLNWLKHAVNHSC